MTTEEFLKALEDGPYAWPGGYPLFFVTSDGGCLHVKCAEENKDSIVDSIEGDHHDGWLVEAQDINWEDPDLFCDHCGERIESAYAEDDKMKYKVQLKAHVEGTTFVTVEATSPEEAKRLAIGEGECNMRVEWDAGDVIDGTVEAVDAYKLKEEDG